MFLRPKPNPSYYQHGGPAQNALAEGGPDVYNQFQKKFAKQID
jgi:hypothetical protein